MYKLDKPSGNGRTTAENVANAAVVEEHTKNAVGSPLLCRRCGQIVSDSASVFALGSERAVRVFPNPYGELREIITLLYAQNLQLAGIATTEFTWFSGYAWEIALCGQCGQHLGWRYSAVDLDTEPSTFYGLLRAAIVQGLAQ